jgi:hypothetical protein
LIFVAPNVIQSGDEDAERPMDEILASLGDELILEFDAIARAAHGRFRAYAPAGLIELDSRAQAACTYSHMQAEAYRRFEGRTGVRALDIRSLKVWHFEEAGVVIRLKKMDEDGRSRNYPTKQAKAFDGQMRYFGIADILYDTQAEWLASDDPATVAANLRKIGRKAGMEDATMTACLEDAAMAQAMVATYQKNAEADDINSTPSFILNGTKQSNMNYDELKTLLDAELAK